MRKHKLMVLRADIQHLMIFIETHIEHIIGLSMTYISGLFLICESQYDVQKQMNLSI